MQRNTFPWFWVALAAFLLLLPGPAGRLVLDLIGGVTLLFLLLPLLAAGGLFLAWQALRSRLITCGVCGTTSFGTTTCPACGSPLPNRESDRAERSWSSDGMEALDAGQVTIDVESVDVPTSAESDSRQTS